MRYGLSHWALSKRSLDGTAKSLLQYLDSLVFRRDSNLSIAPLVVANPAAAPVDAAGMLESS